MAIAVVVELLTLLYEGDGIVHAVGCTERGCTDAEAVGGAIVDIFLLIEEAEGVALLYAEEVDRPPEDMGEHHGQLGRCVIVDHGIP